MLIVINIDGKCGVWDSYSKVIYLHCFVLIGSFYINLVFSRVSQPQSYWHFLLGNSFWGDCPVHCKILSTLPGLCPLNANNTSAPPPLPTQWDSPQCLETFQVSLEGMVVNITPRRESLLCQFYLMTFLVVALQFVSSIHPNPWLNLRLSHRNIS